MKKEEAFDTIKKDIRVLGALSDVSQADIARLIGLSPAPLSNKLQRKSLRADDLYIIANALGYEVVFKKKEEK